MRTEQESRLLAEIGRRERAQYVPDKHSSRLRSWKRAAEKLFTRFPDFWRLLKQRRLPGQCLIAVRVSGGLGDLLRFNAFLGAVAQKYPNVRFDVYAVHGAAPLVFNSLPCVRAVGHERLYPWFSRRYDAYFFCGQITQPEFYTDVFPLPLLKKEADKWAAVRQNYKRYELIFFNQIIEDALKEGFNFLEVLGRTAGFCGAGGARPRLDLHNTPNLLAGRRYITFNTGWNKHDILPEGVSIPNKCWPVHLWEEFVRLFRARCPGVEIIQLGEENSPQIKGADVSLLGRTTLLQAAAVLKGALVHVDCDCGLMHLAYALGVPAVILFGPTHGEYLKYPGNISIFSEQCGCCWHLTQDWSVRCPLYPQARCMRSITPQRVVEAVARQLDKQNIS